MQFYIKQLNWHVTAISWIHIFIATKCMKAQREPFEIKYLLSYIMDPYIYQLLSMHLTSGLPQVAYNSHMFVRYI